MIRIAFIGAGRMASAIVTGLLRDKLYRPEEIGCTCGKKDTTGLELAEKTGIHFFESTEALVKEADAIVLACKPQQFNELDPALEAHAAGRLVISILAGTTLERLQSKFGQARAIIRSMPNTPGQIGEGVTAYAPNVELEPADRDIVDKVLGSLGLVVTLPESQLDAVTAVSGSGPAYVFEFAKALQIAGMNAGLPENVAEVLARETLAGAALLLRQSGEDAEELRNTVTSPGGTTAAALKSMQSDDFRGLVDRAVQAATKRSVELAQA